MTTTDLTAINQQYGIAGHLQFRNGPGGMAIAEIANLHASATVFLQGAHLVSWTPRRQQPVIWLSPLVRFGEGKPIRGGVPVCWPWFAAHATEPDYPFHGYARVSPWQVSETAANADGSTFLCLRLLPDESNRAVWPYITPVEIHFTVGKALEIELITRNESAEAVVLGQALHTYFRVGDVRQIHINGLDGCDYIDKLADGQRRQQAGSLQIAEETDRIYLDAGGECQIEDPALNRRIVISKSGSHSTIVWNPWADKSAAMADMGEGSYASTVCLESANAADDVVTLQPGESHRLWVCYRIESF